MTRISSVPKTLVIGFDAACWEYLDPLLKQGSVPNIERLMNQGVHGTLLSTMPPITPVAWSSIITGVNPGKHGIFEWVRQRRGSYDYSPVTATHCSGTPVWTRLNAAGIKVGVVNVPLTYPVRPLDGFIICGFSAPQSVRDLTYPQDLLSRIEAKFGQYDPDVVIDFTGDTPASKFAKEREHQRRIVRIAASTANDFEIDILIINLMLIDHSNHRLPSMDLIDRAIIDSDTDLGFLLDEFVPDNVILLSDHGSRRVKGVFLLGAWLAEHGCLFREKRPDTQRFDAINYLLLQWLNGDTALLPKIKRRVLSALLPRFSINITRPFWKSIERDIPLALLHFDSLDRFIPQHTKAYPAGGQRGNLNLNILGRDREGAILPSEVDPLLNQLIGELEGICDPYTDNPIFRALYRPEQIYTGPMTRYAPDLIGDYYDSDWSVRINLPGLQRRPNRYFIANEQWFGDHSREGIFVFAGRDFKSEPDRGQASLLDVPATLLYLYDVPQPDDFDGYPLIQAFNNLDRPVRFQAGDERSPQSIESSYKEVEEREVMERLRELGYLD